MARKRIDRRKLHRQLAETDNLRIYQVRRGDTRCVICATRIVDPSNRRETIKENPTLKQRMRNPEVTNGTPMEVQFWLQDDKGTLIGPCGQACGSRAIIASWSKERRAQYRRDLLAAGVPRAEIEDRLEQIAKEQWREMLRVYRKAEREAKKLDIDITTMTYDEVIAAIQLAKERQRYETKIVYAERMGIDIKLIRGGKGGVRIGGIKCLPPPDGTVQDLQNAINKEEERKNQAAQKAAKKQQKAARKKYQEYAEFAEWVLETTDDGEINEDELSWGRARQIHDILGYIDQGTVYQASLDRLESMAELAKSWPAPWTGKLGSKPKPQPKQPTHTHTAGVPVCSKCGGQFKHRVGTSRYGKSYDFYGCSNWRVTDKDHDTMETSKYEAAVKAAGGSPPVTQQPAPQSTPKPVRKTMKAVIAARKKAQQATAKPVAEPSKPKKKESAIKRRQRKGAYWS